MSEEFELHFELESVNALANNRPRWLASLH